MPQQIAPDTLPANYFSDATAPATLPANYFSQPNAPSTLPANFFAQTPVQPAHDPNDRFFSGGQGELRAYQPSVWDRIKQTVTAGIPNYSSHTIYNPRYGETQLLTPQEALTPQEQREHPIVTGLGEVAGGLTSPQSIALIAGTGGLGELPGAAAMLPRLISAGFGAQSIYQAAKTYPEIRDAIARGDVSETERLLTHAVANVAMAALATQHAATGKGAVTGKTQTATEPQPVMSSPTSPISEVLHEPVPEVRVADSAAAAHDLQEKDSVRVNAPSGNAELRNPTARIVTDAHTPVVSQNDVLAAAVQRIINNSDELQKAGIDPSQIQNAGDAEALLQRAADHIRTNLDPRVGATLTFEMQKQLAEERGMTVEELLSKKSGAAFNAEDAIASRALLNASGQNVVNAARMADSDPSALPAMTKAIAQHQELLNAVAGVKSEAGRALGSFRNQNLPATKIADAMAKLDPDAQAEAAKLLSKIDVNSPAHLNDFIEKITPSSTADKIFELYRNSLLSGPATVVKKGASELTMLTLETAKKLAAAGITKLKGGDEARYAREAYWFAKGAIDGLSHIRPALTGELDLADAPGFERTGQQAIKGKVGDVVRLPSRVLSAQTNAMYVLSYFGELNSQAARAAISEGLSGPELAARQEYLVENPTSEMTKAANDTALHNTFQRELGAFGKKVQGAIQADPTGVLRYLAPFVRTPANILKEGAYYSPYGLLKGTLKGDVDMQARGAVGSALAAGIAYLALNGSVTGGGPIDAHKRETLEATGWQPYSVKIGSRYVSYRRLEPTGTAFALVSDAVHGMTHGDAEVVSQSKADVAVNHIARSLQDVSFLPTLTSLTEALTNPGSRAQNFISREVGSLIPAIVKDAAQLNDRVVRRPTGIVQTLESRIPGLSQNVPAAISITGEPVVRPVSALGGANPFVVSADKSDPVLHALAALGIATPQPPTKVKLRGRDVALTPQEQEQFLRQENIAFYDRAKKIMQSPAWARRSDDAKRQTLVRLHKVIDDARPARLARMRRTYGAQTVAARSPLPSQRQ